MQQLLEVDIAASLLPGVPAGLILETYGNAPGNEIASGKFTSPESSAAVVANTFAPFVARPAELPPPPGGEGLGLARYVGPPRGDPTVSLGRRPASVP